MKTENKLGVALVKRACPLCAKIENAEIVMNKRLTKPQAAKVEAMHGVVVGYMDKPCTECAGYMEKGFLFIGVDESKTTDRKNPYRTGNIWVIKTAAAEALLPPDELTKGAAFIGIDGAKHLGLIK